MSTHKSPLYTFLTILVSLAILAGGAAKLFRGVNTLSKPAVDPKVTELLKKSDASAATANKESSTVVLAFQELVNDFNTLGLEAFRKDKRETCTKLSEQFAGMGQHLRDATNFTIEAKTHVTDKKTTDFLTALAKSYALMVKVNSQNMDIIGALQDESIVDVDAVVQKVISISESRDALQKEADEAAAEATSAIKRS